MLKASPFLGEGHRKVKARLTAKGIRVGKNRVLRLIRGHGLLASVRRGHPHGDRTHSGRIRTERPDELWGTDASRVLDQGGGLVLVLRGRRPLRLGRAGRRWSRSEGVRAHKGGFGKAIALGLGLRHNWGSQYRARQSRPRSNGSASAPRRATAASRSEGRPDV